MPEPEIEIIEFCTPYNPNPEGVGIRVHDDPKGSCWIDTIDLSKGEIVIAYPHNWTDFIVAINKYVTDINNTLPIILPKLTKPPIQRYTKKLADLDAANIVYVENAGNRWVDIVDNEKSVFYKLKGSHCYFDSNKDTGIDIIEGMTGGFIYLNTNKSIRSAVHQGKVIMWRSNEFPYKNICIIQHGYPPGHLPGVSVFSPDSTSEGESYVTPPIPREQFYGLQTKTFSIPVITYLADQKLVDIEDLKTSIKVNFNHRQDYYPEDQKRILVVSYDGNNTGKATPFFDLNSLSYKKGYIYRDVDLSKVQLDPQLVAKSKKITLYAFNGQTPFAGVGELAVK